MKWIIWIELKLFTIKTIYEMMNYLFKNNKNRIMIYL